MPHTHQTLPLVSETIAANLRTAFIGNMIIVLDSIPSTNDYAKGLSIVDGPHGTVVAAEEQTEGRGRFGRRWESSKSMNLLFSVLLRPDIHHTERIPLVPFAAAIAAAESIEAVTGLTVECKWPNDLLVAKKKVSGMLLESSMMRASVEKLVLGIGVNVNQVDFPSDIDPRPTSLRQELGTVVDRTTLLQRMLEALEKRYIELMNEKPAALLHVWKSRTTMFGTQVTVRQLDETLTGIAEDISADGSLQLRSANGRLRAIRAGDVTLGYQQPYMDR
jgi:BirA family transcriptional regulator, biotin operon repressor / biotin---[acetyl-CoA-carboxylase] ligase